MTEEQNPQLANARFGFWTALGTGAATLISFGIAIFTPPVSGAFCRADCIGYPYLDIAARFPRDYWMFNGSRARTRRRRPDMRKKFMRELTALGSPKRPGPGFNAAPITEADLEPLPETARRYLRFMRVLGRPRDWSFRLGIVGRFRRSRDEGWMTCEAWQYNTRVSLARIFYMQLRFFGFIPVLGRDTYADGRGRMLIRVLDLITVGDGTGEAYDIGELVTYLNDGVMIAPTLLLAPEVEWHEVDGRSFELSITDHGRTVRARVFIDERGAPIDFETTDRFYADPKDPSKATRCRWNTPIAGWQEVGGRMLPTAGHAVWHPEGEPELAYAEIRFLPETLAFNVAPGE